MDDHGVVATMALLHFGTGKSVAYLGQTEFRDLACLADWNAFERLGTFFVLGACMY